MGEALWKRRSESGKFPPEAPQLDLKRIKDKSLSHPKQTKLNKADKTKQRNKQNILKLCQDSEMRRLDSWLKDYDLENTIISHK